MPALLSTEALRPFGALLAAGPGETLSSLDPAELDALALREKVLLLRGFGGVGRDAFLAWCRAFPGRSLLEWDFGPVMEMRERPGAKNYLFSREAVPYHWDGAFHKVPSFLVFCCVEAPTPGAGGETLFCDTERVWDGASAPERAAWERLELVYETARLAHYGGRIAGPLVRPHPATRRPTLRFAEPVETALNPVSMGATGLTAEARAAFLADMRRRVYDPAVVYRHAWREGDILLADNHALIHARTAFAADCPRHLRRIQLI